MQEIYYKKLIYLSERLVIKSALIIMVLVLIINFSIFVSTHQITYSQNSQNNNSGNIYSWVSKRDNLNITMQFEPKNPVIYYQTKILFKINNLNGSAYVKNITAIVTILDSEGGLYKFGKQKVIDGKTFINYIFPNSGKNKIILQLYENNSGLALASFDVQLRNSSPSTNDNNSGNFFSDLFKNFFK